MNEIISSYFFLPTAQHSTEHNAVNSVVTNEVSVE